MSGYRGMSGREWADAPDVSREAIARLRRLQENLSIHESVKADLARLLALVEQQEKALREIASCESHHPGDVVSIARAALSGGSDE